MHLQSASIHGACPESLNLLSILIYSHVHSQTMEEKSYLLIVNYCPVFMVFHALSAIVEGIGQ